MCDTYSWLSRSRNIDCRWHGIEREKIICELCKDGIEDEVNFFLFRCSKLEHIRE